jgi:hypothetical protein
MSVKLPGVYLTNSVEHLSLELLLNGVKKHTFQGDEEAYVDGIEFAQVGVWLPIAGSKVLNQNPKNSVDVPAGSRGTFRLLPGMVIALQYHTTGGETHTVNFT